MKGIAFASFHDAVHTAHFRAAITRRRYRVWRDQVNRLWSISETVEKVITA